MTDRELLELIAAQVSNLTTQVHGLSTDVAEVKEGQAKLETKVDRIEKTVIKIENDHGKKLSALFDGHKQNTEVLDRIEKEVSKHEKIILRRIR